MTNDDVAEAQECADEEKDICEDRITNMEEAEERFDKNLKVFKKLVPALYNQFKAHVPMSELVFLDNGEPDLVFKGIHLYNEVGAYTFAREQMKTNWQKPKNLYVNKPIPATIDLHAGEALMETLKKADEASIVFNGQGTFRDPKQSYFVLCLGIGLGVYLRELLEETNGKVLLMAEANLDFLYHSLFICDWDALLTTAKRDDIKVEFMQSNDTKEIAEAFGGMFRKYNPSAVDGTLVYSHYSSSVYANAYELFIKKTVGSALLGLGFFEDELNMIAQTYKNLSSGKSRTIRQLNDPEISAYPVFVIGNGPSIDKNFAKIKKLQDRAIIISCGTAIDALLKQGITPDFQIQMERDFSNLQIYKYTAKHNDLSSICLIASTTTFPGTADLFGESVYFFRPGLSSMPIFLNEEGERLPNPDPTVTNGGLATALQLGFKEIYFFGVDVGAKSRDHHHSKSSLYNVKDDALPAYMETVEDTTVSDSFTHELPGNFGGKVVTNDILLWTKNSLEAAIKAYSVGRFFYNCSDGALIDGATPLLPSRVKIPESHLEKKAVVADIINRFPVYEKALFDSKWQAADIFNRLKKMADDLVAALDEHPILEDWSHTSKIMTYLKPSESNDTVAMIYRGTVFLYMISLHYYLNRSETEEMTVKLREIYRTDFATLIYRIRDEAIAYYTDAENDDINFALDCKEPHVWNDKHAWNT